MRGTLFIVSAPSGAGKTTILKRIIVQMEGLAFSVSHTTRKPRSGEQNHIDYHFVDENTFIGMREKQAFIEWAEVHANLYGTSREEVDSRLTNGVDLILDIDVQGARQIRASTDIKGVFIFIVPPSWEELERRLLGRKTDSPESIELRCGMARQEMADIDLYDYVILNDEIDQAAETLRSIIIAQRSRDRRSASGKFLDFQALSNDPTCKLVF